MVLTAITILTIALFNILPISTLPIARPQGSGNWNCDGTENKCCKAKQCFSMHYATKNGTCGDNLFLVSGDRDEKYCVPSSELDFAVSSNRLCGILYHQVKNSVCSDLHLFEYRKAGESPVAFFSCNKCTTAFPNAIKNDNKFCYDDSFTKCNNNVTWNDTTNIIYCDGIQSVTVTDKGALKCINNADQGKCTSKPQEASAKDPLTLSNTYKPAHDKFVLHVVARQGYVGFVDNAYVSYVSKDKATTFSLDANNALKDGDNPIGVDPKNNNLMIRTEKGSKVYLNREQSVADNVVNRVFMVSSDGTKLKYASDFTEAGKTGEEKVALSSDNIGLHFVVEVPLEEPQNSEFYLKVGDKWVCSQDDALPAVSVTAYHVNGCHGGSKVKFTYSADGLSDSGAKFLFIGKDSDEMMYRDNSDSNYKKSVKLYQKPQSDQYYMSFFDGMVQICLAEANNGHINQKGDCSDPQLLFTVEKV